MSANWLAEQRQGLAATARLLALLRPAGLPGALFAAVSVISSVYRALEVLAIGFVVTRIQALASNDVGTPGLVAPLTMFGAVLALDQLLGAVSEPLSRATARRIELHVRSQVRKRLANVRGIARLEDPRTQDDVTLLTAAEPGATVGDAFLGLTGTLTSVFAVVASGIVVARLSGSLAALYVAVLIVGKAQLRRKSLDVFAVRSARTVVLRRRSYIATLNRGAAKEARIYGLSDDLLDRHNAAHREHFGVLLAAYWRSQQVQMVAVAAATVVLGFIGYVASQEVLKGAIGIGEATTYVLAAHSMLIALSIPIAPSTHGVELLAAFDRIRAPAPAEGEATPTGGSPRCEPSPGHGASELIRLEDVSFSYPDSERRVLDGIDLVIREGESLAVVGVNGAGKTSLIKLISGLYEPQAGRILVRGTPLAGDQVDKWRGQLGAVFQDFVQYPLAVRQNVSLGFGEEQGDPDDLSFALDAAGAMAIVDGLPLGLETVLSRQFEQGAELSGGQWQRIALARAIYAARRGASLVLLDEPTANLDVRAEFEVFDRLLEHTAGVASVIVSHRFSTVRKADRIVVIDEGKVVQDGNHVSLMQQVGLYREMFTTQASRFVAATELQDQAPTRGRTDA